MKALLFPGQGSQKVGMGKELFEAFPEMTQEACDILKCRIDNICLYDHDQLLNKAEYTQPALFLVESLAYKQYELQFGKPDMCAGHSLGEYSALFAAGALSFADGLRLTQKRGQIMGKVKNGMMAAIVGISEDSILEILTKAGLNEKVTIANYNTPIQTVVSGLVDDLEKAAEVFENIECARYVMLNVSGPFHSQYMVPAAKEFSRYLSDVNFNAMDFPVIANINGLPYGDDVIELLNPHMTSPVMWKQTMRYMLNHDAELIPMEPIGPIPGMIKAMRFDG